MWLAMRLSLIVGVFMVAGKVGAYVFTGSAAILSDTAESVIHEVAVIFAAFSLWLSTKPADRSYRFGYERIGYFSAGFEGALIAAAGLFVIVVSIRRWIAGIELQNLGPGTLVVLGAALLNAALGLFLVRTGKRTNSIILEANGRHVLTDSYTSFGVVIGLVLVLLTGWKPLDPICAIVVALNILVSGTRLVWRAVNGLMDYADPDVAKLLRTHLDDLARELGVQYHGLRFYSTSYRTIVQVHVLFPWERAVGEAHAIATKIEEELPKRTGMPIDVSTHLEAIEDHGEVHSVDHFTGV